MGCWNKTCGISQFPIFAGQKTINFVLLESVRWDNRLDSQPCYPNAYWDALPLPIYGEYDDYGWQEDSEGQEYKYSMLSDFFKDRLIRLGEEGSFRDVADPFADSDSLGKSIHGNVWAIKPSVQTKSQAPLHLASMMVNRELFETLSASITTTYPKKRVYTKTELCETLIDFKDWKTEKLKNKASKYINSDVYDMLEGYWGTKYCDEKFGNRTYMDMNAGIVRYYADRGGSESFLKDDFFRAVGAREEPLDIVNSFMFTRLMSVLRKQYSPQSGEGSQADIEHEHKLLIKGMREMITARNKLYDE